MPNKVDDFVPYRILSYVLDRLEQIDTALGYNTRPRVTTDLDEYAESTTDHTLFVETTGGSPRLQGAGSAHQMEQTLTVEILGASYYKTEHPRRVAMSLEQDVRTALHSDIANIRDAVGRGVSMRFDRSEHDAGFLAPEKQAGFYLAVSFTWSQSKDW